MNSPSYIPFAEETIPLDQSITLNESMATVAYIVAAVLFILSLAGLSHQTSAKRGNLFGMVGMLLAIVATIVGVMISGYVSMVIAIVPAVLIGLWIASSVDMKLMPQLVAILHCFVGLAAVLVGISSHIDPAIEVPEGEQLIHEIEIFVGVFIGAVTFTGSIVAFLKFSEMISGKPLMIPGRHMINILMVLSSIGLGIWFCTADHQSALIPLLIMTGISSVLGIHMVMAIGGADMPVVVSMLNSYSGWAAAAAGFMLKNHLLIVTRGLGREFRSDSVLHHVCRDESKLCQRHSGRLRNRLGRLFIGRRGRNGQRVQCG